MGSFNFQGALCDVLMVIEINDPKLLTRIDNQTLSWWKDHEDREMERTKAEALAKLTPRERRALGLK